MNLLGMKPNNQLIQWEPFATSTPLKPLSNNQKPKNGISPIRPSNFSLDLAQRKVGILKMLHNNQSVKSKTKITGNSRWGRYFDLNSSSEDSDNEGVEKRRPIIKVNKVNTEKSKLLSLNGRYSKGIKETKNNFNTKDSGEFQIIENKVENKSATSSSDLENVDVSANIPSNNNNRRNVKSTKLRSNKIKEKNDKQTRKNKVLIGSNENKGKKIVQSKLKKKGTENNGANCAKKRNYVEANSTENQKILKKCAKLKNSSHQLFTDTTQEELINTLCLMAPEADELVANLSKGTDKSNAKVGEILQKDLFTKTRNAESVHKEIQKSKRTRQAPKRFWMIEDKPEVFEKKVTSSRIPRKKIATKCEPVTTDMDAPLLKEEVLLAKKNPNNQKGNKSEKPEMPAPSNSQQVVVPAEPLKVEVPSAEPDSTTDYPIFLPLNKVSCIKNETGNEVGECYNLRNFRCGIVKLKPGMIFKREKSLKTIYMGSVVIKGHIKMRIAEKESLLREGDMAFVPPLTEWQATNTGRCKSLLYYWCGKFNK